MSYLYFSHHHKFLGGLLKICLDFLLTKKVQGVVKYNALNGCRPKNVKMFCYLESAIKVRRWTSSLVHTFADSDKIKFDIVFSKEQQVARFDRIVAFAFASTGFDKYVTNRVVFNIGQQTEVPNGRAAVMQPVCAQLLHTPTTEPMEMDPVTSPPVPKKSTTYSLDDSNFEVYRP
ncbi:hypothetical protein ANCCAN_16437 [Ancylostoma caninum]|uniref:Uncharacterized protein n=1 Tax=Ancylostoma caninum TaxID=29170 RepID=A0A368G3Q4_ANCCA|nr:hypothetical protein ANCCAN_16437 [Ancylostoma caninum]